MELGGSEAVGAELILGAPEGVLDGLLEGRTDKDGVIVGGSDVVGASLVVGSMDRAELGGSEAVGSEVVLGTPEGLWDGVLEGTEETVGPKLGGSEVVGEELWLGVSDGVVLGFPLWVGLRVIEGVELGAELTLGIEVNDGESDGGFEGKFVWSSEVGGSLMLGLFDGL